MNNNRVLLLEILHQHSGISKKEILNSPNSIDLKILFETSGDCEIDKEDLKEFNAFRSLQENINTNLS